MTLKDVWYLAELKFSWKSCLQEIYAVIALQLARTMHMGIHVHRENLGHEPEPWPYSVSIAEVTLHCTTGADYDLTLNVLIYFFCETERGALSLSLWDDLFPASSRPEYM